MTNHAEEQSTEIEALESIYYDSFQIVSEQPYCFELTIGTENSDEADEDSITVTLQFTFTPEYPDEAPLFEIGESENLSDEELEKMSSIISEQIDENIGMVMVFTIVTAVQEYLNEIKDDIKKREIQEKERKEKELEELENKKFHGTPVTVETFLAWKLGFDQELIDMKKIQNKVNEKKKMTGKQLFLSDANLLESELLEGENEGVTIDESLFEDLDDLDLDDDPDFDPSLYS